MSHKKELPWSLSFRLMESLTLKGLTFQGFWAQRPYSTRIFGYFDAQGYGEFRLQGVLVLSRDLGLRV